MKAPSRDRQRLRNHPRFAPLRGGDGSVIPRSLILDDRLLHRPRLSHATEERPRCTAKPMRTALRRWSGGWRRTLPGSPPVDVLSIAKRDRLGRDETRGGLRLSPSVQHCQPCAVGRTTGAKGPSLSSGETLPQPALRSVRDRERLSTRKRIKRFLDVTASSPVEGIAETWTVTICYFPSTVERRLVSDRAGMCARC